MARRHLPVLLLIVTCWSLAEGLLFTQRPDAMRLSCARRRAVPVVMAKKSAKPKKKTRSAGKAAGTAAAPFDMKATMEKAMRGYITLRPQDTTKETNRDVYVRAEGSEKFFYVGKSVGSQAASCCAGSAILLNKRVILEHARVRSLFSPEEAPEHHRQSRSRVCKALRSLPCLFSSPVAFFSRCNRIRQFLQQSLPPSPVVTTRS